MPQASLNVSAEPLDSDEMLMSRYGQGDNSAFEQLYLKHKGALYRYFVRQLADKQLAEDLYQETWGRVIKAAQSYQVSAKFTTWLYRIAHNLLIDHVRAVKPLEFVGDDETHVLDSARDYDGEPDVLLAMEQKASLLKHCIGSLPQLQKEAFLLNVEMGFTAAMISDIAAVTLEATKSRIRYAYQSLTECVSRKWREETDEVR